MNGHSNSAYSTLVLAAVSRPSISSMKRKVVKVSTAQLRCSRFLSVSRACERSGVGAVG
jgi:hypothetical protein